jgi:hypothetical protein
VTENTNEMLNEQDEGALAAKVSQLQSERALMLKLAEAGARDMEAALLVGASRLAARTDGDIAAVIAAMKNDKPHLFSSADSPDLPPARTSGARPRKGDSQSLLERAAKRAATSGSRADLQEYLRLRRSR